ncbi:MAG: protein tyrosine phosphatase family protein, partial [Anaerolineae bacterium]|nr:protein tyrosine phosphatase family protein [Anaerolineae bacterium]
MNKLESIINFKDFSDSIVTSGQPDASIFPEIHAAGFQVVINLATANSFRAIAEEGDLVRNAGMDYVHIPVVWENPTPEDFARFVEEMLRRQNQKLFIHCAMNWRVSSFMF